MIIKALQVILATLTTKLCFICTIEVGILRALFALTHLFPLFTKGHALKPQVASIFTSFLDGLKKFYITKVTLGV